MSTMAEVIAAHIPTQAFGQSNNPAGHTRYCLCGAHVEVLFSELGDNESDTTPYLNSKLAAHIAEELAKAGFGATA